MNQVSTVPATSSPANGAEPPPHPGFGDVTKAAIPAPVAVFERAQRSQATLVEQARAIAEVQAAVHVAQERPRDIEAALNRMRVVCRILGLAERAFFAFPRGGQTVSGESVHLARELARCWGNIDYGVKELARSDARGESEMLAFAWDLETNTRNETTFIVPHLRDKKGGPQRLTDMRDIYENNANQGARRVRECVFAVLPKWFTDEAVEICRATLKAGGGKSLDQRKAEMVARFAEIGVTAAMIEKREGKSIKGLTEVEIANLSILYRSLRNNELTKDEAFPETPAADVDAALKAKSNQTGAPEPETGNTAGTQATPPADHTAFVAGFVQRVQKVSSLALLSKLIEQNAVDLDLVRTDAPELHAQVTAEIEARKKWFAR